MLMHRPLSPLMVVILLFVVTAEMCTCVLYLIMPSPFDLYMLTFLTTFPCLYFGLLWRLQRKCPHAMFTRTLPLECYEQATTSKLMA